MLATQIEWSFDNDMTPEEIAQVKKELPDSVSIPVAVEGVPTADYLSDEYGYCVEGFGGLEFTRADEIKCALYETYKKEWMDERGYRLEDLKQEWENGYDPDVYPDFDTYARENDFQEYVEEHGWGGEVYAGFAEFMENEYRDKAWMAAHLTAKDAAVLYKEWADYGGDPFFTEDDLKDMRFKYGGTITVSNYEPTVHEPTKEYFLQKALTEAFASLLDQTFSTQNMQIQSPIETCEDVAGAIGVTPEELMQAAVQKFSKTISELGIGQIIAESYGRAMSGCVNDYLESTYKSEDYGFEHQLDYSEGEVDMRLYTPAEYQGMKGYLKSTPIRSGSELLKNLNPKTKGKDDKEM